MTLTTCPCGKHYQEINEEAAQDPNRMCFDCYAAKRPRTYPGMLTDCAALFSGQVVPAITEDLP